MSVLGDRIVADGPVRPWDVAIMPTAAEWNELRQELIDLRARVQASVDQAPPVAGGLRPCPICRTVKIGPTLVECTSCAGREDAAAKRRADQ